MLSWIRRYLAGAPQRRARRLARDARTVTGMVRETYRETAARDVARRVEEAIAATTAVDGDRAALEHWHGRLRALHGEARRAQDQIGLTAMTLAIIDFQARSLDAGGGEAGRVIAGFLDEPLGERPGSGADPAEGPDAGIDETRGCR